MSIAVNKRLTETGLFKGMHGLEGLADSQEFWDGQPYGTRLNYGTGIADYLHRSCLRSAIQAISEDSETIESLRAEVEDLRHDLERAINTNTGLATDNESLRADVEILREISVSSIGEGLVVACLNSSLMGNRAKT